MEKDSSYETESKFWTRQGTIDINQRDAKCRPVEISDGSVSIIPHLHAFPSHKKVRNEHEAIEQSTENLYNYRVSKSVYY